MGRGYSDVRSCRIDAGAGAEENVLLCIEDVKYLLFLVSLIMLYTDTSQKSRIAFHYNQAVSRAGISVYYFHSGW